ncbi:hypothetical protein SL1157_2555 [Ruegeria lacuscaerulensis ITI-1157]|nr:hypothetical protein SL1157_2555 [Ruegeria lacuscaerulensis ITI-1157]
MCLAFDIKKPPKFRRRMGSIMVYRYRPMRVVPTITTSVFIARGSFLRAGTL